MPLRILLASDGSTDANHAAWLVSRMAQAQPVEVTVITVIQLPEVGGMVAVETWLPELLEREQEQAQEIFRVVEQMFAGTQATLSSEIREGLVGHEIVACAHEIEADLVVVGAKGHSLVDRILLGSISDYVATRVRCSALVVRPTGLDDDVERPVRVAVGFDDSESSLQAVDQFQRFRIADPIHLDVVAVCQKIRTLGQDLLPNAISAHAERRERAAQAAADGVEALKRVTPHVHSHVVEGEHIGESIVNFAAQHRSDFLVVGDTERGMLGRWFLGSVSRFVLRHASCSVWISRHG